MLIPAGLDHAWITQHIPHQGAMCLLDHVAAWDEQRIECRAGSHRDPGNPLRAHGRLGAACGIEYAAQAMAVHGALLAPADGARAKAGYLVSVRGARLHVASLDDIAAKTVPESIRSNAALSLPPPVDEAAVLAELRGLERGIVHMLGLNANAAVTELELTA